VTARVYKISGSVIRDKNDSAQVYKISAAVIRIPFVAPPGNGTVLVVVAG
jgi:hypothetical protein